MFDAHCHLDDPRIQPDIHERLAIARQQGLTGFLCAGVCLERWQQQQEIAQKHTDVFLAYGLHPWWVETLTEAELQKTLHALEHWLTQTTPRPIALGELGLDRSRRIPEKALPALERAFREQLALARDLNLPVVLHAVKAHGRLLEILRRDGLPEAGGMIHGFSGSSGLAEEYQRQGLYLSIGGAVTRLSAKKLRKAVVAIDSSRILVETDSPDQLPLGFEETHNSPASLPLVLAALAECRGETISSVVAQTTSNVYTLFALTR
jgi:TatD DNase family protein